MFGRLHVCIFLSLIAGKNSLALTKRRVGSLEDGLLASPNSGSSNLSGRSLTHSEGPLLAAM
jgi:hypothetical protein